MNEHYVFLNVIGSSARKLSEMQIFDQGHKKGSVVQLFDHQHSSCVTRFFLDQKVVDCGLTAFYPTDNGWNRDKSRTVANKSNVQTLSRYDVTVAKYGVISNASV